MASFFKYFNINTEQRQQDDCLLQGQGQLDQRVVFSFFASFGEGDPTGGGREGVLAFDKNGSHCQ